MLYRSRERTAVVMTMQCAPMRRVSRNELALRQRQENNVPIFPAL